MPCFVKRCKGCEIANWLGSTVGTITKMLDGLLGLKSRGPRQVGDKDLAVVARPMLAYLNYYKPGRCNESDGGDFTSYDGT